MDPSLSASATVGSDTPGAYYFGDVDSLLEYTMIVEGPPSATVPVDVIGSLSASFSADNPDLNAYTELGVAQGGTFLDVRALYPAVSSLGLTQNVSIDQTIDLVPNTPYEVVLNAAAIELVGTVGVFTTTASVDPTFKVDPAFANANPGYFLQFSPNVVPDRASTLGLLAVSLAGIAALGRKTRFQPTIS
jgi:hypothetical protein